MSLKETDRRICLLCELLNESEYTGEHVTDTDEYFKLAYIDLKSLYLSKLIKVLALSDIDGDVILWDRSDNEDPTEEDLDECEQTFGGY